MIDDSPFYDTAPFYGAADSAVSVLVLFIGLYAPAVSHAVESAREKVATRVNVFFAPNCGAHHSSMTLANQ